MSTIKKCKKEAGKPRKKVDKAALLKKKPNPKGPIGAKAIKLGSSVPEDLDKRIDVFELRIAENYVPKTELSTALERVEQHMIRIENKLDSLVNKKCSPS